MIKVVKPTYSICLPGGAKHQMSTQVLTEQLARLDGRYIKRWFKHSKIRTRKLIKSKIRKTRSSVNAWYRRQYFISNAYSDMKLAIAKNEDIFIGVMIIAGILGYSYAVTAAQIVYTFFLTGYILSDTSGLNVLLMSMGVAGMLATLLAWITAFTLNAMSISVMQGATRKINRSIRQTLRQALKYTARTTTAWLLFATKVSIPAFIGCVLAMTGLKLGVGTNLDAWLALPIISVITGFAFSVRSLLKFGLMPQVATFETGLTYAETFTRSEQLLRKKGKLFLAASYASFTIILSAIIGLSFLVKKYTHLDQGFIAIIGAVLLIFITNGIMVMFYRKRRLARD